MTIETLLDILSSTRVNITDYDKDTVYIAKPDQDSSWYNPDPWDEVYNTLEENGINFATSVCRNITKIATSVSPESNKSCRSRLNILSYSPVRSIYIPIFKL